MKRLLALLLLSSCGGASTAPTEPTRDAIAVTLQADATVADLAAALSRALVGRGHEGECFLAWDAAEPDVTVRIGDRARSAALSCGGLSGLSDELEGRCPGARVLWVRDRQVAVMGLVFGAPGDAFAGPPIGMAGAGSPATDAVFFEAEGGRLVLAVQLEHGVVRRSASKKQEARTNLLDDPAIQLALRQLVARVQRCNPSGEGSLVMEWRALADGTLTDARPLVSSVGGDVVRCALDMVNATSFPEGEAESVSYCAPVLLAPGVRPVSP